MKRGMKQKAVMAAGLFVILAAGCSQEEAGPAVEEAESAEVSEANEEAAPETEESAEESVVEEQEADSEESDSEEQQETSAEETVEEETGEIKQEELAALEGDWITIDELVTGNFLSFSVKLNENNSTFDSIYANYTHGQVSIDYEIIDSKNGVITAEGDSDYPTDSTTTLELLDNDKLLWKQGSDEETFEKTGELNFEAMGMSEVRTYSEIDELYGLSEYKENNGSIESTTDSTSGTAAESETASEPETESMSLEEQLVEELIQYGIGNGGTRDSFTFYDQAWETGADGNQYYVMIIGDASVGESERIHTFHGGEDGHLYFLNLDTFPNEETAEYTRVDSY